MNKIQKLGAYVGAAVATVTGSLMLAAGGANAVDPTTPAEVVESTFTEATPGLLSIVPVVAAGVIAIGLAFWALRTVLRKLGMGGTVTKA